MALGEQGRVPGEVEAPGDDHHQGVGRQPVLLAPLALGGVRNRTTVVLRAHRPGADHHRVDAGPQADQHRGVGGGADRAGASRDRRVAVEREREVRDHVGTLVVRLSDEVERGDLLGHRRLGDVGQQPSHGFASAHASALPASPSISPRCSTFARSSASLASRRTSVEDLGQLRSEVVRRLSEHVRVVPAPRALGGRRSAHSAARIPGTLFAAIDAPVRSSSTRSPAPRAPRPRGGRLARPGPVVALHVVEGPVGDWLVPTLAQLGDHRLGNSRPLVCRDCDPHPRDGSNPACCQGDSRESPTTGSSRTATRAPSSRPTARSSGCASRASTRPACSARSWTAARGAGGWGRARRFPSRGATSPGR